MASFGARKPQFAPIIGVGTTESPYEYDTKVMIGKMVSGNMTITTSSGELYANDALAEQVTEFVSASLPLETDDMLDAVSNVVYGADVSGGTVTYNAGDEAPLGGLAYIQRLMRNRRVLYKGFFYPQAKAAIGNDNAQTKGSSITFGTTTTNFTIFADANGDWRKTFEAGTEADVQTWIDTCFSAAPAMDA